MHRRRRQPRRPHFIPEWAELRDRTQAELARDIGADKSVVSRWFAGATPGDDWQKTLADYFHCEPEALFRHPDDHWLTEFFAGRSPEEIKRAKEMLELAFPRSIDRAE